jgi:hypothetical protein
MTIISIHQPGYIPWLGFFDKIFSCEKFVFLDDVQFQKNEFQNRNKIRVFDGDMWLTVPVKSKSDTLLYDVKIDNTSNWIKKHIKSIELNYSNSEFFNEYWPEFELIFRKKYDNLINLNIDIIKFLLEKLKIKTETICSSELNISDKNSDRILKICKALKAETYISGISGKNYLNIDDFKKNGIDIIFQKFQHPTYHQVFEPFHLNMSTIDLLFNEGGKASKIIKNNNNFSRVVNKN